MNPQEALEHLVNRAIEGRLVPGEAETLRILVSDLRGQKKYPYAEGELTVLGPEVVTDGEVISWRGNNFIPQPTSALCGHTVIFHGVGGARTLECLLEKHDSNTQHEFRV